MSNIVFHAPEDYDYCYCEVDGQMICWGHETPTPVVCNTMRHLGHTVEIKEYYIEDWEEKFSD